MADDSELDYLKTFLRAVCSTNQWTAKTVASVVTATKSVTMTAQGGTLNQWADMSLVVESGDNTNTEYRIVSNTNATPTTLVVKEAIPADLATDVVGCWDGSRIDTIETTRNIHMINDTQSILVYAGESLSADRIMIKRQYNLQFKDASEGALNANIYALCEGMDKLNARETITAYTKPASLIGISFLSGGKDYHQMTAGEWYTNIKIIAKWLTS